MCHICQIVAGTLVPPGGVIFQNDLVILSHVMDTRLAGYVLLSSTRHVSSHEELTDNEMQAIGCFMKKAIAAIKTIPEVERVYVCSFCEETPHIHFHLFPRYRWMLDTPQKMDPPKLFNHFRDLYKVAPEVAQQEANLLAVVRCLREAR